MRSPIVDGYAPAHGRHYYSDLQVLVSGAGYYIGTIFDDGIDMETGSRDSVEYYPTRAAAQEALDNNTFTQRMHP